VTPASDRPKPEICPLSGRFWVNTLAQEVLRKLTQWPWIEHPTFQLSGGQFITELVPPKPLAQWFPNCVTRTISGKRRLWRWCARQFCSK